MFSRRMIRRYLYGVAGLAVLIALFYAEEDWRGKQDWELFKRAAEAKGERFDFSSFIPPPVPDDQNFAFTPIVSNSCVRVHQPNTNVLNLLDIRLNAHTDWKPWPTNDFQGNWQCGMEVDLEAFQTYYRTPVNPYWRTNRNSSARPNRYNSGDRRFVERYATTPVNTNADPSVTNEFPVAPQPQSPAADVLLAWSKYDSAIEELRQASRLPYSRFPFNYDPEAPDNFSGVSLAPLSACGQLLRLRAVAELQNGQNGKALDDVRLMLYLAKCHRGHWLSMGELDSTLQPLWQGLADHHWTDAQLAVIGEELAKFDFLSEYQTLVRSQCAWAIKKVDFGERRRSPDFWAAFYSGSGQYGNAHWGQILDAGELYLMPKGWFYQTDLAVAQWCQKSLLTDAEVGRRILSVEVAGRCDEGAKNNYQHRWPCNFLASRWFDNFAWYAEKTAFTQSSLDLARVACALERHRLAQGEYPVTLEALAPWFRDKLPHDIINGQPLHYRRTDDGRFLLYSVGWNGTDDGGIVVRQKNHLRATLDMDKGDWVWPNPVN